MTPMAPDEPQRAVGPGVRRLTGFLPAFRADPLHYLERCRSYGDVIFLPYGRVAEVLLRTRDCGAVLLLHPADIRHVLVTNQGNYPKIRVPPAEVRLFGRGVLHREGAGHQHHRRLLLPSLGSAHHERFAAIIVERTAEFLQAWLAQPMVELSRAMTHVTLAVIWEILFHEPLQGQLEEIAAAITTAQDKLSRQYNSLFELLLPLTFPTVLNWRFAKAVRSLDVIVYGHIQRRRSASGWKEDVVTVLMHARDEAGEPLRDRDIRDELMTLLLAGHETTANALEWAWILLADHPEVLNRLHEEVVRVCGAHPPSWGDLPRLLYTRMVWEEVLRLYPPAWMLHIRHTRVADRLPSGVDLSAGTDVYLSPYATQRDPRWFAQPAGFDPQHRAPHAQESCPPFAYFPFGGGARHCLGEGLAQLEGPLILATIAQRARPSFLSGQTVEPRPLFTLRPNTPLWVRFVPTTARD